MQKLYKAELACKGDYSSLKYLWQAVFGDSKAVVDNFFNNTAEPLNIVCVKENNRVLSALYIVDAFILSGDKQIKGAYIYAVATLPEYRGQGLMILLFEYLQKLSEERNIQYLFLVPENEALFKMYEKLGFETALYRKQTILKNPHIDFKDDVQINELTFKEYMNYKKSCSVPVAALGEKGFNSFYKPADGDVSVVYVKNEGYFVLEKCENEYKVYELFGNRKLLLDCAFHYTKASEITLLEPCDKIEIPYGMIKNINNAPKIKNAFFGVPYNG